MPNNSSQQLRMFTVLMWPEPIPVTRAWIPPHPHTHPHGKQDISRPMRMQKPLHTLTTLIYSLLNNTVVKLQLLAVKKRNM